MPRNWSTTTRSAVPLKSVSGAVFSTQLLRGSLIARSSGLTLSMLKTRFVLAHKGQPEARTNIEMVVSFMRLNEGVGIENVTVTGAHPSSFARERERTDQMFLLSGRLTGMRRGKAIGQCARRSRLDRQ